MTLKEKARQTLIFANGARARHQKYKAQARAAQLAVARVLMEQNRERGYHYTRAQEKAVSK